GGPREVTPVIYSENGPVHILTEENIKTEMADGAKSMPEIAGKVMDRKVDEFNKTKEALIEKLVKGAAEVSPPIENVEEQLKEWNITPEGWGKEDQLKFWTEHPSLDKKELDTIFRFNSQSGNTLSCDVIKKYLDSGFIESSKGLSDNRLVDLMKVFEHPDTAKFPLVNLIGENWTKKDLFNAVEWEIEDNKLKISFDVKDNFTDVDLIIYENGTIAVDGHGFQNWNLGKPVPLTDENLRAAMGFINKTDGTGAVSISQESLQGEP
ncbi:hypothetical protein IIA95_01470, partial [Patescibacteria group bacterium]|nr:hypothetical protein [Patescibacteria group bacterium]